jgi:anaerobic magnesium-protoporphyrin IX monomethyl ester cyclase
MLERMRIALLYPPPWKLADSGEPPFPPGEGPPIAFQEGDLDVDFWQTPYGLLSLAAQAMAAGHRVQILNLSAMPWRRVEAVIEALDADLWGLSCWTANRRGVAMTAACIKALRPRAHVVVGGPHATPLAREMLEHYPAIDTICVGESEETFLELAAELEAGRPARGLAGTWYRDGDAVAPGPKRPAIRDLDALVSPHEYFATHIVMTSRGCPWQCTFCGAETSWGRGFRAQSVDYVVDALENALARVPVRMLQIKDDTFTTNKKRVVELCRAIRARGLRFLWSCDTRVDVLDAELLREMRLAGCERLSLGVESGSQRILDAIDKRITVDEIAHSTEMARAVGIRVRYFMMLGNRGETAETFDETLRFLERSRPHQFIFSCLSVYPGTVDFRDAETAGWLDRRVYFEEDFQELKVPFDASESDTRMMTAWFREHSGIQEGHRASSEELGRVLEHLGEHHAAHMDLAGALFEEGDLAGAWAHAERALELGYPCPGLAHNLLACVAAERRDLDEVQAQLRAAVRGDPQHYAVATNAHRLREWLLAQGPAKGLPLTLVARHDFQLFERTSQPVLPGPLPEDFADFDVRSIVQGTAPLRPRDAAGSRAAFGTRGRLRVLG